jgi:hypothetical protein
VFQFSDGGIVNYCFSLSFFKFSNDLPLQTLEKIKLDGISFSKKCMSLPHINEYILHRVLNELAIHKNVNSEIVKMVDVLAVDHFECLAISPTKIIPEKTILCMRVFIRCVVDRASIHHLA